MTGAVPTSLYLATQLAFLYKYKFSAVDIVVMPRIMILQVFPLHLGLLMNCMEQVLYFLTL